MVNRKRVMGNIRIIKSSLSDFSRYYCDSKYMKEEFEKLVDKKILIPFLVLSGNRLIGKVHFVTKLNDLQVADGNQIGYMCNLFVKKSFRNNGIGTMLVDAVKDYAKSIGFTKLTIGVEEDNSKNMYLYNKLGFSNKIKDLNIDLLFKDAKGNDIKVKDYAIYSCDL